VVPVKLWLEKTLGLPVVEKIQAHSGAIVEKGSTTHDFIAEDPEVNLGLPTINGGITTAQTVLCATCEKPMDVRWKCRERINSLPDCW
jgi:hypothetical protein